MSMLPPPMNLFSTAVEKFASAVHFRSPVAVVSNVVAPTHCRRHMVTYLSIAAGLVESFGKFKRLLKPGFNMINPCSEEVAEVDLRMRVINVGRHVTMTKDSVKLDIDASVAFRVINPIIAHYVLGINMNRALI